MTTAQKQNQGYSRKTYDSGKPNRIKPHGNGMYYRSSVGGFTFETIDRRTPDETLDAVFASFEITKDRTDLKNKDHIMRTLARKAEGIEGLIFANV